MKKNKSKSIKVRKTWGGMRPTTKVKPSKKIYKRKPWYDWLGLPFRNPNI